MGAMAERLAKQAPGRICVTQRPNVDHTTVWRWGQYYGPDLEQRLTRHCKATNKSWRVDETCVRVKGRWCYLYRAMDSRGATIDFLLSALRSSGSSSTKIPPDLGLEFLSPRLDQPAGFLRVAEEWRFQTI
jgi:hypothetical protein